MCVPLSAAGNKRNRIEFAEEKLHAMEEEEEEEVMQKLKKRIKKGSTTVVPVIASDESGS
jgi:glutaredoxin